MLLLYRTKALHHSVHRGCARAYCGLKPRVGVRRFYCILKA